MSELESELARVAAAVDPTDALAFEVQATALAVRFGPAAVELARRRLLEDRAGAPDRLLLFVTAVVACRRLHDRLSARLLVDSTRDEFGGEPLYWHFRALTYLLHGSRSDLREGLAAAENARRSLPDNPGVLHTLACFHADLAELDGRRDDELREALELVDRAIGSAESRPPEVRALYRGRFYYTRARFLRRMGRYDEARDDLLKAIDLEDRSAADHSQRISDYVVELALIDADRSLRQLTSRYGSVEERLTETAARLEGAELRVVQVVTFVAGVLAVLQVGVGTIGQDRPFWQVVSMVGLLAATIFGAIVLGSRAITRHRTST